MDSAEYKNANMVFYFDNQYMKKQLTRPPPLKNKISILMGVESPQNSYCFQYPTCIENFNWTITLSGDIKHWYINQGTTIQIYFKNKDNGFDYNRDVWSTKMRSNMSNLPSIGDKGIVSWVASNCNILVNCNRLQYVEEMMNHIRVDSYGKCLNNIQMEETNVGNSRTNKNLVIQKYKFYLAFENSLCENYITEKALDCLIYGVVPVIMAHPQALKLMPEGSYIFVGDFNSSKSLAQYLKYLDENDKEYEKYFQWRKNITKIEVWRNTLPKEFLPCVLFDFYQDWKDGKFPLHKQAHAFTAEQYCLPYDYFKI
ncbi:hypothetical protein DLAC_02854 [Tieghemostelium lacteum]|uniref:Fucosyltransferase n=1 Tax=Tieghemostelium lacteum TaxID=361077 RepID=A0A152A415_TIELA|nr:hypothetical protein DLAC_02854 [Tieghemostelium lacteum]|eukprot:KYR00801.1 hypothetical protein DLAC_02854 [Tieghemostelium lacteum]